VSERLFRLTDRDKPFELTFTVRRKSPEIEGSSIGFNVGPFTLMDNSHTLSYWKMITVRDNDPAALINKIRTGYCLRCGNCYNPNTYHNSIETIRKIGSNI
jgi:hypothetical protein